MKASYIKHNLQFKFDAQTSREILKTKKTYILTIEKEGKIGVGECAFFRGLSYDKEEDYETKLQWVCNNISVGFVELYNNLIEYPSIKFGLEQAFINLGKEKNIYFESDFTSGNESIKINGLIWMGKYEEMLKQIKEKIEQKFTCVKIKIDDKNWENQYLILKKLRERFNEKELQIRVDANGAFNEKNAPIILEQLAQLKIHSIEQPIKQGNLLAMKKICKESPIPIALDEELIGVFYKKEKRELLEVINPQFIILKPSLVGGFKASEEWINLAKELNIGWWITSALESNIGLNAIAQWTYMLQNPMPQGLGTGNLYSNNFTTPLYLKGENLYFNVI